MVLVVGLGLQVLNRVRSIEKMVGAARESVAWFKWWCLHLVVCDGEQPVAWWFYLFKKRHLWWLGSRLVGSTRAGVATSKRENKENEKRRERNRGWRAWLLPLQSDATGVCCVEMLWDVEGVQCDVRREGCWVVSRWAWLRFGRGGRCLFGSVAENSVSFCGQLQGVLQTFCEDRGTHQEGYSSAHFCRHSNIPETSKYFQKIQKSSK